MAETLTRVDGHAAAMDFTRRWPDLSASRNLEASELSPISNTYTDSQTAADAEQQMPLIWPTLTPSALDNNTTLQVRLPSDRYFSSVR
jgi:hypothetical protein